jgi:hypothetical protein
VSCAIVAVRVSRQVHAYLCDECDKLSRAVAAAERVDDVGDTSFNSLIQIEAVQRHSHDASSPLHDAAALLAYSAARSLDPSETVSRCCVSPMMITRPSKYAHTRRSRDDGGPHLCTRLRRMIGCEKDFV